MDPASFVDGVREDNRTALSRLGSSKALYADTDGEMETGRVLEAAATAEHHAAETFAAWADEEDDPDAAAAFHETASEERDHYATVVDALDGDHEPGEPPAIQAHLRAVDGTVERVGGLVGRTLAAGSSKDQLTGFFVGQADPGTSQLFRDMGEDLDAQLDRALELLESQCGDDADCWERAGTAAAEAIQVAYGEYTERLEALGVNPKPVC